MKYWTIAFPGECGQHITETWTEDQILSSYYNYWCERMIEAGKRDEISTDRCIDDWVVVHWAKETDQWGCNIPETK